MELRPTIDYPEFDKVDMRVVRVLSAPMAEGTIKPSRVLTLDAGPLGQLTSVGQFALVPEEELVGSNLVACRNLGTRKIGRYRSEALVLGALHPANPPGQSQATPLRISVDVPPGSRIF